MAEGILTAIMNRDGKAPTRGDAFIAGYKAAIADAVEVAAKAKKMSHDIDANLMGLMCQAIEEKIKALAEKS